MTEHGDEHGEGGTADADDGAGPDDGPRWVLRLKEHARVAWWKVW